MFNNYIGIFNGNFAISNTGVYGNKIISEIIIGNKEKVKEKEVSLKWDDTSYVKITYRPIEFSTFKIKKDEYIKSLENRVNELEKELKYVQMELKYNYLSKEDMDKIVNYINKKNIEGLKRLSV